MSKFFSVECVISFFLSLPVFFWLDYRIGQDLEALIQQCSSIPGAAADNAPASGKRSAEAGAGAVAALPPAAINFGGYAASAPVPVGNTGTTLKTIAGGSDV